MAYIEFSLGEEKMLKKIGIKNFKAFKEKTFLELERLNVVAGVNSSGKSSLYQSLLLLIQSAHSTIEKEGSNIPTLNLKGEYLNIGQNKYLLNDIENKKIDFQLEFENNDLWYVEYNLEKINNREKFILKTSGYKSSESYYITKETGTGWQIETSKMLKFENQEDVNKILQNSRKNKEIEIVYNSLIKINNVEKIFFATSIFYKVIIKIDEILKCISEETIANIDFEKFKKEYVKKIGKNEIELINTLIYTSEIVNLGKVQYIPPFRGNPERVYLSHNHYEDFIDRQDEEIEYCYDFIENKKIKGSIKEALNYWIIKKLKIAKTIEIREINEVSGIEVLIGNDGKKLPLTSVGFGISQIIPIIYKVLSSKKELILIDEPEIHLHPKIQSELAEFFFIMSKLDKCLIVETHSEYMIEKLIYLKIKYLEEKNISLKWVEKESDSSKILDIEYDNLGYILNAPSDFLSEREKLIEELNSLRLERL